MACPSSIRLSTSRSNPLVIFLPFHARAILVNPGSVKTLRHSLWSQCNACQVSSDNIPHLSVSEANNAILNP